MGVAEEHHHRLALEVGDGAHLAVMVGQREVLAEVRRAGDVDIAERGLLLPAGSHGQRKRGQQGKAAEGGEQAGGGA
ncbi:hypothetical protein D3C72_1977110 [compost metagenome]